MMTPSILFIIGCLTALPSLANASPPDPLWIDGIYDAADHAVAQAASCDAAALRSTDASYVLRRIGFVAPASSAGDAARPRWRSPRSPPVR